MDSAAKAILGIAFSKEYPPFAINLVHPHPIPWSRVIEAVQSALVGIVGLDPVEIPVIPFSRWVGDLFSKSKDAIPEELEKIVRCRFINVNGYLSDTS